MQLRTFTTPALVLKRVNVGEHDRIVTLLTRDQGKVVAIAKGVRKVTSSRRADVEPGSLIRAHFVITKGLPILTQTVRTGTHSSPQTLSGLKQLLQVLEIIDSLFVEADAEPELFDQVVTICQAVTQKKCTNQEVKSHLMAILSQLGYPLTGTSQSIADHVSAIIEKPLLSWRYLSTQT